MAYEDYVAGAVKQDPDTKWLAQCTGLVGLKEWRVYHPTAKPHYVEHVDVEAWIDLAPVTPPTEP
jgi:hypothetical protein